MQKCINCNIYRKEYDELLQSVDDKLVTDDKGIKKHSCVMYDGWIDTDIWNGKKECEFYYTIKSED